VEKENASGGVASRPVTERRALLEHVEGVVREAREDAALRRALLLVAPGADPHRTPQPDREASITLSRWPGPPRSGGPSPQP
jgi:hypothetical protein